MILPLVQVGVRDSQELIDDSPIKLDVSSPHCCREVNASDQVVIFPSLNPCREGLVEDAKNVDVVVVLNPQPVHILPQYVSQIKAQFFRVSRLTKMPLVRYGFLCSKAGEIGSRGPICIQTYHLGFSGVWSERVLQQTEPVYLCVSQIWQMRGWGLMDWALSH